LTGDAVINLRDSHAAPPEPPYFVFLLLIGGRDKPLRSEFAPSDKKDKFEGWAGLILAMGITT
jgi:hypothetical protein